MTTWRSAGMRQMLGDIEAEVAYTRELTGVSALDGRVLGERQFMAELGLR